MNEEGSDQAVMITKEHVDGAGIEDQRHQVDGETLELDTNQKDMLDFQINEDSEDRRE